MSQPHPVLDSLQERSRIDPHDMMGLVRGFPEQCRRAVEIGRAFEPNAAPAFDITSVIITGLGGSAIGGDFARCLAEEYGSVPVVVNRDYSLPHFVGPHTLVVAASYSE